MTNRLPRQPGEWIDRERPLRFRFEGEEYTGYTGDTLSSALAANGVRLLGRSFKYHRPRGIYSLANHDCNALMCDGHQTNIRADVTPLWEGADVKAVNTVGGLRRDRAQVIDRLGAFLPVGFYYKTFHTPRKLFPFYERQMRAMAGLGAINRNHPRVRTPKAYDFCDVLVVGAGPAGLAAAIAAAEQGAQVVLVDENPRPGGSLGYQWAEEPQAAGLLEGLLQQVAALPNLEPRLSTVAAGYYADHWIALVDARRLTKMRARTVVIASGCHEQPAVFGNNDLPGVMLASAAQRLMHRFAVKPFERALVLAANTDGYRAALQLHRCGVKVQAIVDLRPGGEESELGPQAAQENIPIHVGHAVTMAVPAAGKVGIRGAVVCLLDAEGKPRTDRGLQIDCDGIAMSVGWAAADGLLCQAGGRMAYSERLAQFVPKTLPPGLFAAGRVNGVFLLPDQIADGKRAGLQAAAYLAKYSGPIPPESCHDGPPPSHPYPIFPHPTEKSFVDLDEDVQYKDLVHSAQEGFDSAELMKRYSTYGMGPSQGKIANVNAIRILAKVKGQTVAETGTTTSRPFYHPVPLSHLAGRGFHPHRRTPLHSRHEAAGAEFMAAGEWLRPAYYAAAGKTREQAIQEEVQAVRQRAGLIDVGTLGKLEISGPDAAEFIERIYTGRFARMKIGTSRYGLMCDETGVIIDDGVVARLAEDRFYVTTTTTASGSVYREMQRWALLWGLDVVLVNATGSYAAMNLAGPRSRQILADLTGINLAEEGFPYLGVREGEILGIPARVLRVGFVGELGYEIHVPAHSAARVWDGLMQAGQFCQIRPFGVEAQRVLRLEKGHVIVGQDTDGLTTPREAHMEWAVKADKPFFVGQRSLAIQGAKESQRRLVGFVLPQGYAGPMPKECHLVIENGQITGRVTSICFSPTLGQVIGLAYVAPSQAAPGSAFQIRAEEGAMVTATVVEIPFYDPKNLRQTRTETAK
ncbi:MAG TPA: glycine cleavage T C-terminal barrel domain-containing protein [Chthonomonadaceae bacterium]|nr:glycine cleavage T C-terminal barrel domain-containing protein [Chthonomonadaceae bacterium]